MDDNFFLLCEEVRHDWPSFPSQQDIYRFLNVQPPHILIAKVKDHSQFRTWYKHFTRDIDNVGMIQRFFVVPIELDTIYYEETFPDELYQMVSLIVALCFRKWYDEQRMCQSTIPISRAVRRSS